MSTTNAAGWLRVIRASLYKNWRLSLSYPSWIANRILSPLVWVTIAVYAYVGIADTANIREAFRGATGSAEFTGFLIIGQTIFSFFQGLNWRGGMAIQRERWYGTLELVMQAPISRTAFVLGESLFGLVDSGWTVFLAMVLAIMLYGADFDVAHPEAAAAAVVLTLLAMVSLGLLFAGFYVLTRAAGPLAFAIQAPVRFLSGTQFPIAALPAALQATAYALPVTYGLHVIRRALLAGDDLEALAGWMLGLVAMSVLCLIGGHLLITRMEKVAKQRGSLHEY